jgi:hypothetical protein
VHAHQAVAVDCIISATSSQRRTTGQGVETPRGDEEPAVVKRHLSIFEQIVEGRQYVPLRLFKAI